LIDPFNPAASPLRLFQVTNGDPGFDSPGARILMESNIPRELIGNPFPLQNDDYAGRQFLYPYVICEPTSIALAGRGLLAVVATRWRRSAYTDLKIPSKNK
jgi:hypothetical protein